MENIIDQIELYLNKFESPLKVSERSLMNKVYKIKKLSEIHNLKDFLELVKTIYIGKSTCVYNENIQLERAKEYYNTQSKDLEVLKSLLFDKKQIYIDLLSRLNNPKYKFYKSLIEDYVFKVPKRGGHLQPVQ
jgi:formate dehydrogenase maturation protein FdhE